MVSPQSQLARFPVSGEKLGFLGAVGKALPYLDVALSIVGFFQARKQRKQAKEAAYEELAVRTTLTPGDTGANLPVLIGRVRVHGLFMFAAVGANVPWQPDAGTIGGLDYWQSTGDGGSGGVLHTAPAKGNNRDEFLLTQEYLARHDLHELRAVALDGEDIWPLPALAVLGAKGAASDLATRFAAGHGGNPGNLGVLRGAADTFPLGSHATLVAWQDVDGDPRFNRVPDAEFMLAAAKLPTVAGAAGALTVGEASYSTSAPRTLLWLYTADWGFGVTAPAQAMLASVRTAQTRADAVMQGRGGLWAQTYPATHNTIEGTRHRTYAEAFRSRGYAAYSALTQARSDLADSADPGPETGWPAPRASHPNAPPGESGTAASQSLSIVKGDWQAWTIKRAECSGRLIPANNLREMLGAVLQCMPFSSFARTLADGERALVYPDLDGDTSTQALVVDEDTMRAYSIAPAENPYDAVEVHFADSASNSADATVRFPTAKRGGADTPARTYVEDRLPRANALVVTAPLVDNHFHAWQLAWTLWTAAKADVVTLAKHGANAYADVGDIVRLTVPSRGVDLRFLVESCAILADGGQQLVGLRIAPHMSAWAVRQKPGSRIAEELAGGPLPIGPICATEDDGVVTLDFECEVDDDGDIVAKAPAFEAGCGDDRRAANGAEAHVALPVMGPGSATYTVTGARAGIVHDSAEHRLTLAASLAAGRYPITVNGTVGDTTASCSFALVVVQGETAWDATLEGELGAGPLVQRSGDEWRVFIDRGDTQQFGARVRVAGSGETTGKAAWGAAPTGATFAGVANQTLEPEGGDLLGSYVRYAFTDDNDFDGAISCTVTVGGQSRVLRIIVSRNAQG